MTPQTETSTDNESRQQDSAEKTTSRKKWIFFTRQKADPENSVVTKDSTTETADPTTDTPKQDAAGNEDAPKDSSEEVKQGLFDRIGLQGLFLLLVFFAIQCAPDFYAALTGKTLYCPGEVQHIKSFLNAEQSHALLAPVGFLPAEWPGLFWLTKALASLSLSGDLLFTVTSALAMFLLLITVWNTARLAYGAAAATASGLILLASPLILPEAHFYGPLALAPAFFLCGLTLLCSGWGKEQSWLSLPVGFCFIALAGFSGGLFFLLLPLITSFFFLLWCSRYKRAQRADSLFGFLCLIVLIGAWLGFLYIGIGDGRYLESLLAGAVKNPWPIKGWERPLALLLFGAFPWVLLILFPAWITVAREFWTNLKSSRNEHALRSALWISFVFGAALLLTVPDTALPAAATCVTALLAILLGKTLVRLPALGTRCFIIFVLLLLLCAAALLCAGYFDLAKTGLGATLPWLPPDTILSALPKFNALPILAFLCLLGVIVCKQALKKADPGAFLLSMVGIATLMTLTVTLLLVPALAKEPFARLSSLAAITQPAKEAPAQDKETKKPAEASQAPAQENTQKTPQAAPTKEPKKDDVTQEQTDNAAKKQDAATSEELKNDKKEATKEDASKSVASPKDPDAPKQNAAPANEPKKDDVTQKQADDAAKKQDAPTSEELKNDKKEATKEDASNNVASPKNPDAPKQNATPANETKKAEVANEQTDKAAKKQDAANNDAVKDTTKEATKEGTSENVVPSQSPNTPKPSAESAKEATPEQVKKDSGEKEPGTNESAPDKKTEEAVKPVNESKNSSEVQDKTKEKTESGEETKPAQN